MTELPRAPSPNNKPKENTSLYMFCLPYKTIIETIENAQAPAAGTQMNRQYQPLSSTQSLGYVCAGVGESSAVPKVPGGGERTEPRQSKGTRRRNGWYTEN